MEAITLATMLFCFRFVAQAWGEGGLSEWVLLRRVLAYVLPVVTFGYEVALPRFIAISETEGDRIGSAAHRWATATHVITVLVLLLPAVTLAPQATAHLVFGSERFAHLCLPLFLLCAGLALALLSYSNMRGEMHIRRAGLLHFTIHGGIPLVILLLMLPSVATSVTAIGITYLAVGSGSLWWQLRRQAPGRSRVWGSLRMLSLYGSSRMLTSLGLMLLLALPVIHLANEADVMTAAYLGFALSVLVMCGSLMTPIGVVLLPHLSAQHARGPLMGIGRRLLVLEAILLVASAVSGFSAPVWGRWVAAFVMLDNVSALGTQLTVVGFLIGPFMYYILMRQVIDAATTKPVTLLNIVLGIATYLVVVGIAGNAFHGLEASEVTIAAFAAAIAVLAAGTAVGVRACIGGRQNG